MTTQLTLRHDWQQITDGSNQAVIQFCTLIELCDSPTKPSADTPCMQFNNTTLTINPPRQIWVRTPQERPAGQVETIMLGARIAHYGGAIAAVSGGLDGVQYAFAADRTAKR